MGSSQNLRVDVTSNCYDLLGNEMATLILSRNTGKSPLDPRIISKFDALTSSDRAIAEYVWVDAVGNLRSKARTLPVEKTASVESLPKWNFDGSSTGQAPGDDSEVILRPCRIFRDPFRPRTDGIDNILVMCDTYTPSGEPISTNFRAIAEKQFAGFENEVPWFGLEQEFTLFNLDERTPLGWPEYGYPKKPQGPYYCSVGPENCFGRAIVECAYKAMLYAGLDVSGTNGEVMPGQQEYQIGPCVGLDAGDQLMMSRYILQRVCEDFQVVCSFHPKPIEDGEWNGAGMHTNVSTQKMRDYGGIEHIKKAIYKLGARHQEHIAVYGKDNEKRLSGKYETANINQFSYGVANRGASVRIGRETERDGRGYFEDRRPASNADPYLVTGKIMETIMADFDAPEIAPKDRGIVYVQPENRKVPVTKAQAGVKEAVIHPQDEPESVNMHQGKGANPETIPVHSLLTWVQTSQIAESITWWPSLLFENKKHLYQYLKCDLALKSAIYIELHRYDTKKRGRVVFLLGRHRPRNLQTLLIPTENECVLLNDFFDNVDEMDESYGNDANWREAYDDARYRLFSSQQYLRANNSDTYEVDGGIGSDKEARSTTSFVDQAPVHSLLTWVQTSHSVESMIWWPSLVFESKKHLYQYLKCDVALKSAIYIELHRHDPRKRGKVAFLLGRHRPSNIQTILVPTDKESVLLSDFFENVDEMDEAYGNDANWREAYDDARYRLLSSQHNLRSNYSDNCEVDCVIESGNEARVRNESSEQTPILSDEDGHTMVVDSAQTASANTSTGSELPNSTLLGPFTKTDADPKFNQPQSDMKATSIVTASQHKETSKASKSVIKNRPLTLSPKDGTFSSENGGKKTRASYDSKKQGTAPTPKLVKSWWYY